MAAKTKTICFISNLTAVSSSLVECSVPRESHYYDDEREGRTTTVKPATSPAHDANETVVFRKICRPLIEADGHHPKYKIKGACLSQFKTICADKVTSELRTNNPAEFLLYMSTRFTTTCFLST